MVIRPRIRVLPRPGRLSPLPGWDRRRVGIAAVEFAMVAPLLALIIVGMFELSRGMQVKDMLSDAARKGCRTGIQRDKGNADITTDVTDIMVDNHVPQSAITVTITVTDPDGNTLSDSLGAPEGSKVAVQVGVPVANVMWMTGYFLTPSTVESEVVVMAKQ
jgi:Flp pilus assembly protein TadG